MNGKLFWDKEGNELTVIAGTDDTVYIQFGKSNVPDVGMGISLDYDDAIALRKELDDCIELIKPPVQSNG